MGEPRLMTAYDYIINLSVLNERTLEFKNRATENAYSSLQKCGPSTAACMHAWSSGLLVLLLWVLHPAWWLLGVTVAVVLRLSLLWPGHPHMRTNAGWTAGVFVRIAATYALARYLGAWMEAYQLRHGTGLGKAHLLALVGVVASGFRAAFGSAAPGTISFKAHLVVQLLQTVALARHLSPRVCAAIPPGGASAAFVAACVQLLHGRTQRLTGWVGHSLQDLVSAATANAVRDDATGFQYHDCLALLSYFYAATVYVAPTVVLYAVESSARLAAWQRLNALGAAPPAVTPVRFALSWQLAALGVPALVGLCFCALAWPFFVWMTLPLAQLSPPSDATL